MVLLATARYSRLIAAGWHRSQVYYFGACAHDKWSAVSQFALDVLLICHSMVNESLPVIEYTKRFMA